MFRVKTYECPIIYQERLFGISAQVNARRFDVAERCAECLEVLKICRGHIVVAIDLWCGGDRSHVDMM